MPSADTADAAAAAADRTSEHIKFRPDIEGLRAVAVLAVVFFHAEIPGVRGGFVGVDVFFVISGFLITGMLWREAGRSGTINLRRFYGARARRLLPASATVGAITVIASILLLPALQVKPIGIDAITSALYVSNYWFAATGINYFGKDNLLTPSPFKHYWSLGVEEQFYLVWPVLIIGTAWLVRRWRAKRNRINTASSQRPYLVILALIAVTSFGLSLVTTYFGPPLAYFSLPTRAWQLAAGGLVALTAVQWRRLPPVLAVITGWTGLAVIALACGALSATTVYPGTAALLPTLGAVLVIAAGCAVPSTGCGRALGLPPMRAIGRLSYSWYLWHWPVLVLAPALMGHPLGLSGRLVAIVVSAALAVLTLRFVENPLRFAAPIRNSPRASLTLGAAATAVAVGVGAIPLVLVPNQVGPGPAGSPLVITAEPPAPGSALDKFDTAVQQVFAQVQAAVSASVDLKAVPSNLKPPLTDQPAEFKAIVTDGCLRLPFSDGVSECLAGDPASATKVALIGDSRAAMLNAGFRAAAERRGWQLQIMSRAGCPLVDLPISRHFNTLAERVQLCARWSAQVMARLQAERTQLVVISLSRRYGSKGSGFWQQSGFEFFDPGWINALARTVRQLRDTGAQVLVLGPLPEPATSVPNCLSAHLEDAMACSASVSQPALSRPGVAAESAAVKAAGGHYADVIDLFCAEGRCPPIVGDTLVYFDGVHITREYSRQLWPAMAALGDRALAAG